MRSVRGKFLFQDITVDYDFQLMGKETNDAIFRLRFNKTEVGADTMFMAGLMLMHYLANDCGIRINVTEVPNMGTEQDSIDATEKYRRGFKQ